MYGLVNASLMQFIIDKRGEPAWQRIASAAHFDDAHFDKMHSYPDALTYELAGCASTELNIPLDTLLGELGKYWVEYTQDQGYGHFFEVAGPSLREFLFSLDELHARVGRSFLNLRPPSFRFDPIAANSVRMHYVSERKGLCPFVIGLLEGLSTRFNTPLSIDEVACARKGADHCEFNLVL
jgi:predicted hydrocarbon binding protein